MLFIFSEKYRVVWRAEPIELVQYIVMESGDKKNVFRIMFLILTADLCILKILKLNVLEHHTGTLSWDATVDIEALF